MSFLFQNIANFFLLWCFFIEFWFFYIKSWLRGFDLISIRGLSSIFNSIVFVFCFIIIIFSIVINISRTVIFFKSRAFLGPIFDFLHKLVLNISSIFMTRGILSNILIIIRYSFRFLSIVLSNFLVLRSILPWKKTILPGCLWLNQQISIKDGNFFFRIKRKLGCYFRHLLVCGDGYICFFGVGLFITHKERSIGLIKLRLSIGITHKKKALQIVIQICGKQTMNGEGNNKKVKRSAEIFCHCYDEDSIKELVSALKGLENYGKMASIMLSHQQKSISTVSPILLNLCPELRDRVDESITRVKNNVQFFNKVKSGFLNVDSAQLPEDTRTHAHGILQLLGDVNKEWGTTDQLELCEGYQVMRQCMNRTMEIVEEVGKGRGLGKVLVEGHGTGRILHQIASKFTTDIEATDANPLHHITAEYMLTHCEPHKIYPYIHNFANLMHSSTPYTTVTITGHEHTNIYLQYGGLHKYKSNAHNEQFETIITYLSNEQITHVLEWIQIIYKNLKVGGKWIYVGHSTFSNNIVELTHEQFVHILNKSQFQIRQQKQHVCHLKYHPHSLLNQKIKTYFLLMQK